ncbi:hypothetical protein [Nocardia spumae]|uniref:hypothetical protein n=1 Tax=Nocardia spumae TaxID=2887190 RepID=UPI001D14A77B|nr:hypothetical protein [Nocardia spumae]
MAPTFPPRRRLPALPWQAWRRYRTPGSPLADLVLNSAWKAGPMAEAGGPFMISLTQFTTTHIADVPDIWRASERLGDQLAQIDGAVGVLTYIRPWRRQVGSLSIWADERGLSTFIGLPYHVEIMRKYKTRGLPIRSAKWWAGEFRIGAAMMASLRMLDSHPGRRVTGAPGEGPVVSPR